MSRPTSFEDPLDCKLQKRHDLLTDTEIYNNYLQMSKQDNPSWTRQQHRKYARDWFKKGLLRNQEHIKQIQSEYFSEFDSRFGVLSLTANPKLYDMWDKYSDNHQGYCIGFDTKKMFKYLGGGGEVVYYEELPDILPSDSFDEEHFKQVFSKELKWSFEEEYRTHKFYNTPASDEDRKIRIPKDCFKVIIFGARLQDIHKQEIFSLCKKGGFEVEFYNEVINENHEITLNVANSKDI
ncbi:MAG: DUF2971 domain-containing protein [Bacteroidia bacterium]|nr:DUF2971 domain-containing protein [Bacteroidia bacterium]